MEPKTRPRGITICGLIILISLLLFLVSAAVRPSPPDGGHRDIIGLKIYQEPDKSAQAFDSWKNLALTLCLSAPNWP